MDLELLLEGRDDPQDAFVFRDQLQVYVDDRGAPAEEDCGGSSRDVGAHRGLGFPAEGAHEAADPVRVR